MVLITIKKNKKSTGYGNYTNINDMLPATKAKFENALKAGHKFDFESLEFECKFCGKHCYTGGITSHAKVCKLNPNRIDRRKWNQERGCYE